MSGQDTLFDTPLSSDLSSTDQLPITDAPATDTPAADAPAASPAHDSAPPTDDTSASTTDAQPAEPAAAEPRVDDLRPVEIVRRLDEFIVGQAAAKRAVAIALRNRFRRRRLPDDIRGEVLPKNILMIGPTGVGKTEIARRLARMTNSPFIKVEATKFTEVGYVGRDVESIVRDLLEQTITDVQHDRMAEVEDKARDLAEERILDVLVEAEVRQPPRRAASPASADLATVAAGAAATEPAAPPSPALPAPPDAASGSTTDDPAAGDPAVSAATSPTSPDAATLTPTPAADTEEETERRRRRAIRRRLRRRLDERALEDRDIDIEVEEPFQPVIESFAGTSFEEMGVSLSDFFSQLAPPRKRLKRLSVADARTVLIQEESDRLIDMDRVYDDAIRLVEEDGIVFVDEVDKIAGQGAEHGPDVSGEGVQRDLLPVLEGSTVHTRYGSVHTDHILFVAAGAFNVARPSDLIPEFQGRFPIRVELQALSEDDLQRILVEPSNALTKQYAALLGTEEVTLEFAPDGLREIARQAATINEQDENIGARRLFTILEKVLEDLSFSAEDYASQTVIVDAAYVRSRLGDLVRNEDLRRYIL